MRLPPALMEATALAARSRGRVEIATEAVAPLAEPKPPIVERTFSGTSRSPTLARPPVTDPPREAGPNMAEARSLNAAIDRLVGAGCSNLDLLENSERARTLLAQLIDGTTPLLPRHAAAMLIAITPADGITAASARAASVLSAASPLTSHIIMALLELITVSAQTPPRAALLLGLLARIVLGQEAMAVRDDGGLSGWSGAHLLLASALRTASSQGRLARSQTCFTRCVQMPIECVVGGALELAEELMEGVPLPRGVHESSQSMLGRSGLPICTAILAVTEAPPLLHLPGAAWDYAAETAGPAAADPAVARGERPGLREGDVIIAVDGKLLTSHLAQLVMTESRRNPNAKVTRGVSKARILTIMRECSTEHAVYLIDEPPPMAGRTQPSSLRASPEKVGTTSQGPSPGRPSAPTSLAPRLALNLSGEGVGLRRETSGASERSSRGVSIASLARSPSKELPQRGDAMTSPGDAKSERVLHPSESLEALRARYLREARDRAAAEGAALVKQQEDDMAAKAEELLAEAAVEAEAVRLRKRSQSQAESEAQIRATLEAQKKHELAELTRAHKAEIERLQSEHGASVAALSAAVAALESDHPAHAKQLQVFADAVGGLHPPSSPSGTEPSSTGADVHETLEVSMMGAAHMAATLPPLPPPPSYLLPPSPSPAAAPSPASDFTETPVATPACAPPGPPSAADATRGVGNRIMGATPGYRFPATPESGMSAAAGSEVDAPSSVARVEAGARALAMLASAAAIEEPSRAAAPTARAAAPTARAAAPTARTAPTASVAVQTNESEALAPPLPVGSEWLRARRSRAEDIASGLAPAPAPSIASDVTEEEVTVKEGAGIERLLAASGAGGEERPAHTVAGNTDAMPSARPSESAPEAVRVAAWPSEYAEAAPGAAWKLHAGGVCISYNALTQVTGIPEDTTIRHAAPSSNAARLHAAARARRTARRSASQAGGTAQGLGAENQVIEQPQGLPDVKVFAAPGLTMRLHTA